MKNIKSPVIVALDFRSLTEALTLVDTLNPADCRVKIGKELFTAAGPDSVRHLGDRGFDVFLDLKFHDIPNTVRTACLAAADLGCWMINVHTSGGKAMMEKAADALSALQSPPILIGVTTLTSLDNVALKEIGISESAEIHTLRLASLAKECGLAGVVSSPLEVSLMRESLGSNFLFVTPGVRPLGANIDDQARIATPLEAMAYGASYLVVGRPITSAPNPASALAAINEELVY
ncbi:orotidine-5'-phosphate decarboxylase [Gammaproteobacteria bacterium]|nr:orotidine-5'-phosphate decarboxylase [Gammaproteobacteria bacterium]